jgi:pimeloyl-ACP methyl ester carboxylesterase
MIDRETSSWAFVNCRGYGDRKEVAGEYTNAEIAADVLEVADRLDWQDFALVGHSMGGKAIQRVYADAPDRVTVMIGVAPIHADPFPFDDAGWALFLGAAQSEANRYTIIDFTTGNRNSPTWVNRMVSYSLACSTKEAFGGYLFAWGKEDFLADLPTDDHPPVHLIVGEHDPAVGLNHVRTSWQLTYPDARVDVLANAGHYPMWETPVALLTSIEKALAR